MCTATSAALLHVAMILRVGILRLHNTAAAVDTCNPANCFIGMLLELALQS
jgi:hypothetical protein